MFPTRALSQVLAVPPALDSLEREQAGPRAAFDHLKIGQTLTGLVKGQSNGVSLVEVGGQTVTMRLPSSVGNGDALKLRFSGHMPQPVFMLETLETAATGEPDLSKTARMLSNIMQRVPERAFPTLMPANPLLNQATVVPAELALALRTALVRSGLFYESHLANWVAGQDTLDGLMQEPQNRQAAESSRAATTALALADAKITADPKLLNPMHMLLTQQLQVLESPQLAWRGELWPGHSLEWQIKQGIEGQPDDANGTPVEEDKAGWESHLKLTLPHLGTLNVSIKLDSNQTFSIRMMPEKADTAPLLQRNQPQLIEQLAAAGCALQSVKVEHDASA